ncbi:MAG: hypothetical protein ACK5RK_15955 [Betaproteobacteria bacterium]
MPALDALPRFHLAGLNEIVYAPIPQVSYPSLKLCFPDRRLAEFDQQARAIYVYRLAAPEEFRHVLYHEIGHFVFFLVIGSKVKKTWVTELFPGSATATVYGAESAAEGFAETYALYAREAERLRDLPLKQAFMREQVFSGRLVTLKAEGMEATRALSVKRVLKANAHRALSRRSCATRPDPRSRSPHIPRAVAAPAPAFAAPG